jgi:hypothetical protein
MKHNDYVLEGGKGQNASSFVSFISKLISFFVSIMNVEESFVEKLQR